MRIKHLFPPAALIILVVLGSGFTLFASVRNGTAGEMSKLQEQMQEGPAAPATEEEEKMVPGPKTAQERTAVYVFLVWIWAAVFVLIYIFRGKIKESDRLYQLKYFEQSSERK